MMFLIVTNNRQPISTPANTVTLTGLAPLRVFNVVAAGHPEAQFTWVNESTWTLTGILLHAGVNQVTVQGVDEFGAVLHEDMIVVNKTGNAPPVMAVKADPSWEVTVLEQFTADGSDSYDPEGAPLQYSWSVTPSDASLDAADQNAVGVTFPRPGLYTIALTCQDANNGLATIEREAAVCGSQGLSLFDLPRLESFWKLENVAIRTNYATGPSYSLSEVPGNLVLQVWSEAAYPLGAASPKYPLIWRSAPASTDWAFLTRLSLRGQIFADYMTGVLAEINEGGSPVRYAFGIEDGTMVTVRRITASGVSTLLQTAPWNQSQAELRIRRTGNTLFFEQRADDVWTQRHFAAMPAGSIAVKTGMIVATDAPQAIKVAFDEAALVDPSSP
jgi:hypothetical protein